MKKRTKMIFCVLGCLGGLGIASGVGAQSKTFTNSVGMEFVLIPAGEFMMGTKLLDCPEDDPSTEKNERGDCLSLIVR